MPMNRHMCAHGEMSATVIQELAVTQIVHAYYEWSNNRNAENCVFSANFKSLQILETT